MPVRTWCLAVATGLVLFTASSASYSQTYGQDANRAGYPQNYSAVSDLPFHVSSDTEASDPGCEEGHDDRKSDLCAQWKAADAAAESANVARVQLWLGTIIGALTLFAAAAAAVYAGRAAKHTARSVAVTEEMGRAQTRAYIDAIMAKIHDDTESISVRVTLRNEGQTPAKAIVLFGTTQVVDVRLAIEPAPFASLREGHAWGPLRSGGELTVPITCDGTTRHYNAVESAHGPLSIRAFGRVRYITIFDETYETEFSFHTNRARHMLKSGPDNTIVEDPIIMSHEPAALKTYERIQQASGRE